MYLLDGVTGPQTNPLGDRTVLLLGFGKLLLGAETLVALYKKIYIKSATTFTKISQNAGGKRERQYSKYNNSYNDHQRVLTGILKACELIGMDWR